VALVCCDEELSDMGKPWKISRYPGEHPMRIMARSGPIDGMVVQTSGVFQGIVPTGGDGQIQSVALLLTDAYGRPGDSGSLVMDLSWEQEIGPRPWAIYLGQIRDTRGWLGRSLMLVQVQDLWHLEFFD
jgi:hypothetical protein